MVSSRSEFEADDANRVLGARDPQMRRAAILAAARSVFSERGYTGATIREIARRAGVTHGLVTLHFSTKENLFLQAVPGTRDLAASVRGDRAGLASRVARSYVQRMESAGCGDPFIALVRSAAADQDAATSLLRAMHAESLTAYSTLLDGSELPEKVDLIGAVLIGVTFSRYVVGQGPLASMPAQRLIEYLTAVLAVLVDEPPSRPEGTADAARTLPERRK